MMSHVDSSKYTTEKLLELIKECTEVSGYKINLKISCVSKP